VLPPGYKVACDSAFYTRGGLEGKLVNTKDHQKGDEPKSEYDEQLTALRQSSEWGNNVISGVYRRLTVELRLILPRQYRIGFCAIREAVAGEGICAIREAVAGEGICAIREADAGEGSVVTRPHDCFPQLCTNLFYTAVAVLVYLTATRCQHYF
jgi:hypothetical protein